MNPFTWQAPAREPPTPGTMERFSDDWARAWCRALDGDEDYRRSAERWDGGILFVVGPDRKVFLDLRGGRCLAGRVATSEDEAAAAYAIEANEDAWADVLDGRLDPIMGLMRGKLRLAKGSLASLLPFTAAAQRMVKKATEL